MARPSRQRRPLTEFDLALADDAARFFYDPAGFTRYAYPWGEPGGPLAAYPGPDSWQMEVFDHIGRALRTSDRAVRVAISSGHGIGKTAFFSMLINWFMTTRPDANVVATSNTKTQLQTKLWRELALWHKRSLFTGWFEWMATSLRAEESPETWVANAIPWSKTNPEAFAGLHGEHVLVIIDEACHDDITEVMTDSGWKLFSELTGDDLLLTMDPVSGRAFFERPTRVYKHAYSGEMYEYTNRGANFCVTPNHKMLAQLYRPRTPERHTPWALVAIDDLARLDAFYVPKTVPEYAGGDPECIVIPGYVGERKTWLPVEVPALEFMTFLGWYFSEGSLLYQANGAPQTVVIAQKDPRPLKLLSDMVSRWGLPVAMYKVNAGWNLNIAWRPLGEMLAACGRGCLVKRLPKFVLNAGRALARAYLDAHVCGDGYEREGSRRIIYTSNEGLAGDLQAVALKAGYNSTVTRRALRGKVAKFATHTARSSCDGFVVSISEGAPRAYIRKKHLRKVRYDGFVYCAEVSSHHTLLTRRNGVPLWSGNSAVHDIIWETLEGALTTEGFKPLFVVAGNPTRSSGGFYRCFTDRKTPWKTFQIDSRTARMTNKTQLQEWIDRWGVDSNFAKVRIYGQFPSVGDIQFIPTDDVDRAMFCKACPLVDDYLLFGVDVARKGTDSSVIQPRRSNLALPPLQFRIPDTMMVASKVADEIDRWNPDTVFVDGNGLGAGVVDRLRQLGFSVIDVIGQSKPNDPRYYNKRAECYGGLKEWLRGAVHLPADHELSEELIAIEYDMPKDRILLEDKDDIRERLGRSPDKADALALTFAEPINAVREHHHSNAASRLFEMRRGHDWRTR